MILHDTVIAVVKRNNKILMIQRAHKPMKGIWDIPGGHVDKRESIRGAAMREIKEEVGDVELGRRPIFSFIHDVNVGHKHKCHVFPGKPSGKIRASSDAKQVRWLTLNEIKKKDITQYAAFILNKIYSKKA